jgi:ABC-type spermidine/putrescine transport system permease subunit I
MPGRALTRLCPDLLQRGCTVQRIRPLSKVRLGRFSYVPLLLFMLVLFIYPMTRMLRLSLFSSRLTLEHYQHFYAVPIYSKIFLQTFLTALRVTILTLLIGYPVAYFLASIKEKSANILMIFIIIPFWVSILIRTFAWTVILQSNGVINQLLIKLGLVAQPLKLLHNTFAVHVGMIHIQLPFMILSLYGVMKGIDPTLTNAAMSLGASSPKAFYRVYLPLSLPGVAAGTLLVFIMSLGFYITPAVLGGTRDTTIPMVIENQVSTALNWGFASALAAILLVLTLVVIIVENTVLRTNEMR